MSPILLDTHAALWIFGGKIKGELTKTVDLAAQRGELLLSPITAWEVGMLVQRGRLRVSSSVADFVRSLFRNSGVVTAVMTPEIAVAAATLPGSPPNDPADRILIATASAYGASLVTRDRTIHQYAKASGFLRCVPC
jgi:PIN domain nuclease of toxin-antitoxin system